MRQTKTSQETSKLGPFAFAALGIHGAAILLGSLGTPAENPPPAYEILVAWETPEEPRVSADDAPSIAPLAAATQAPVAAVQPLKVTNAFTQDEEGSSRVAFKEASAENSTQMDAPDDQAPAIDVLGSIAGDAETAPGTPGPLANGGPAGVGLSGKSGSRGAGGGAAERSGKGHAAQHKATLVAQSPCTDLFPYGARIASATVAVKVDVDPSGKARLNRVLSGLPPAGGFGAATMACSARLRFEPARDASGVPITSEAVVRLHFERNG